MINLIGTYECKIDAKGRLSVPSDLKKQLATVLDDSFVVKRTHTGKCLELYPRKVWDLQMQKINKLNRFKKENIDFIRKFTAGVKVVDIDSAGRVLIPKELCTYAGIEKEIVLSSLGEIIEIWDKKEYEDCVNSEADISDLAEKVMGNFDTDEIS